MLQFVSQFAFLVSTKLDVADDSRELTSCHVQVNLQCQSVEGLCSLREFEWEGVSIAQLSLMI